MMLRYKNAEWCHNSGLPCVQRVSCETMQQIRPPKLTLYAKTQLKKLRDADAAETLDD